jgi:hypothetical protein
MVGTLGPSVLTILMAITSSQGIKMDEETLEDKDPGMVAEVPAEAMADNGRSRADR